jgi:hypothetical protein
MDIEEEDYYSEEEDEEDFNKKNIHSEFLQIKDDIKQLNEEMKELRYVPKKFTKRDIQREDKKIPKEGKKKYRLQSLKKGNIMF